MVQKVALPNLPNKQYTSVGNSINLVGTLRDGGVEKAILFEGADPRAIYPTFQTSLDARFVSVNSRIDQVSTLNTSAYEGKLTSVTSILESRISTVSSLAAGGGGGGTPASVLNRLAATSAAVTSLNTKLTTVSSKLTSVNENTTSLVTRVGNVSGKATSVNNRLITLSAVFEDRLSAVSALAEKSSVR